MTTLTLLLCLLMYMPSHLRDAIDWWNTRPTITGVIPRGAMLLCQVTDRGEGGISNHGYHYSCL